ncbi:MAG: redoxin domain-containing protein [Verrucomicrobia bacterium]|jgi:peroxiredoxin|nr:redoxin domain-containing protein [Verrucomicrobiota bacterium]
MKRKILSLLFAAALALPMSAAVKNGDDAPAFTLTTMKGKEVSLSDYEGKTVVLEWVNPGCPFVRKFYDKGHMGKFQEKAAEMGVVWLAVNSTSPGHRDYLTPKESRKWAKEHGFAAKWLMDPDGTVGKAYGAKTTPHMYIINPDGKVVYQGAIDSIRDASPASIGEATNYVMEALTAMEKGEDIPDARTRPYGCSVKYRS